MQIFIEISKGTNTKYEYDEINKCLVLDRILHNTNRFPYNYGFVPNTLSPDGDPLDIIVLCDSPLLPGTMVDVKIIGGIDTNDEKGQDDKLIAVANNSPFYLVNNIQELNDNFEGISEIVETWFTNYKGKGKMKSSGFGDKNDALKILNIAISEYKLVNN